MHNRIVIVENTRVADNKGSFPTLQIMWASTSKRSKTG